MAALSGAVGRQLSPALVWRYPTIDALSAYVIDGEAPQARRRSPAAASRHGEPIAVIGLACRFPGAHDIDAFWRLLSDGVDAVGPVPADRWSAAQYVDADPDARGKMVTADAGYLDSGLDEFDPLFFGIAPREAEEMDPQQSLFLEVAWEALEDAGVAGEHLRGSRTAVVASAIWDDYAQLAGGDVEALSAHSATGRSLNMVANRLSYVLGLRGPSLVVDSACSSSLLAVHLACQSLRCGDASMAIVGGVNLLLDPATSVALTKLGALSPDGRCKAFDARADGLGRGEGCGVVVLKALSTALADGDDVVCTIRGSAVNNDGPSSNLTAPNPAAQEDVLREAHRQAGTDPRAVHYVETHGTGTMLGDPIEALALGAVLAADREPGAPLLIGSVKTNIGHLEGAAGIAGFIKVALSLRHRQLPRSLHFETPNPHIAFEELGLRVASTLQPWPQGRALLAGVSSFGWGGTNVHAVLEGWQPPSALPAPAVAEVGEPAGRRLRALPAAAPPAPKIAFVCSPHGQQWAGMGRQLFRTEPVFRAAVQRCDREFAKHADRSLAADLFAGDLAAEIDDVAIAQPLLFTVQVALAEWLQSVGVRPAAVVGHSVGEIAAAVIAGVLELADGVRVVYHYSRQQSRLAGKAGGMAIVELAASALEALVTRDGNSLVVAARNGPRATALSGDRADLRAIVTELKSRGVVCAMIRVNIAAHSPAMDDVLEDLQRDIGELAPRPGRIPMISTVTAQPLDWRSVGAQYFARNLREPVLLAAATSYLLSERHDVLLEISADPVLLPALAQSVEDAGGRAVALGTMRRGDDDRGGLVEALARLESLGVPRPAFDRPAERACELVTLSAKTPAALSALAERVAGFVDAHAQQPPAIGDLSCAAARRADHPHRLAVVAGTGAELAAALRGHAAGDDRAAACAGSEPAVGRSRIAFVFPGQGSQWIGMGRELLEREPVFEAAIRACDGASEPWLDWSLLAELQADDGASRLDRIDVVQPVLFAVQVALAALWRSWGVEPDAVVGHSMGEIAAAHVAGALSIEDAARVICRRSALMRRASGRGGMLAVELELDEAQQMIADDRDVVSIAVSNSRRSTVLSGDVPALQRLADRLDREQIFRRWIKVDLAAHSPQMDPLRDELLAELAALTPRPAALPIYSTVSGAVIDGERLDAQYWARNLRDPVLFAGQVEALIADGFDAFLEISPHAILVPAVEQVAAEHGARVTVLGSLRRGEPARPALLGALGQLYVRGLKLTDSPARSPARHTLKLPSYPWQRERLPRRGLQRTSGDGRLRCGPEGHPLLGRRLDSAIEPGTHYWQIDVDSETASVGDHRIGAAAVMPGAAYVELALAAAAQVMPGKAFAVTDVRFHEPLVVAADRARRLQVVLTRAGERPLLRVFAAQDGDLPCVAEASLRAITPSAVQPTLDLAALEGRMAETIAGGDYYRALAGRGLDYGPAFAGIEQIWRADGQALTRLRPPAPAPGCEAAYCLQPAWLDAALQALVAPLLGPAWGAGSSVACLTRGIARVVVQRSPAGRSWAHAVVRDDGREDGLEADVRVVDEAGELLVEVTGVSLRRVRQIPRLAGAAAADLDVAGAGPGAMPPATSTRAELAAIVSTEERRAALEAVIRDNVARVVKLAPERISLDQPLAALGINSVMSLELRSRLERELGLRLSATLIWNYPTIREAAPFLAAKMDLALAGEAGSEPRAALAGAAGSEPRAALAGEAGSEPRTAVAVADRHGRPAPAGDDLAATDPEQLLRRELDELTERLEAI